MKKVMFLVLMVGMFINPTNSFALSCAELPTMDKSFGEYEAVIAGKVLYVTEENNKKMLDVEIEKSFKGVDSKNIVIEEDLTWGMSEKNNTYLFFLNKVNENWENPLCSPTTLYSDEIKSKPVLQNKDVPLINKTVEDAQLINTPVKEDTKDNEKQNESKDHWFLFSIFTVMVILIVLKFRKK
jgi:hypothetical protein